MDQKHLERPNRIIKGAVFLMLICSIAPVSHGQDSVVEISYIWAGSGYWKEIGFTGTFYDSNGKIKYIETFERRSGVYQHAYQEVWTRDEDGKLIQKDVSTSQGGIGGGLWDLQTRINFVYGADGNLDQGIDGSDLDLKEYTRQIRQGDQMVNERRVRFGYGTDEYERVGRLRETITQTWDGNQWVNSRLDSLGYEANGDLAADVMYEWNTGTQQWDVRTLVSTVFDYLGRKSKQTDQSWDGNQWHTDSYVEWMYPRQDSIVTAWHNDGSSIPTEYEAVATDTTETMIIYKLYQADRDQNWRTSYVTSTTLTNGKPAEQITQTSSDGVLVNDSRIVFVYDFSVSNEPEVLPTTFSLSAVYPNPFNLSTTFVLSVDAPRYVDVSVYNALGQLVSKLHDGMISTGAHSFTFEASGLPSGVYLIRVASQAHALTRAVVLTK